MNRQSSPSYDARQLQRDIYYQAVEILRAMLPAPLTDTPEAWTRRDRVAIAKVAAMVPADPEEGDLAAYHVALMAQVGDALRQVLQHADDVKRAAQLRAQAACSGREARGYLSTLLRMQAARRKHEATDVDREEAAQMEHSTFDGMAEVLDSMPPAWEAAAALVAPTSEPPPPLTPEEAAEAEKQELLKRRASRYAILHTVQVKRIRQHGGLPPDCDFEPPDPELLHAIVTGDGSNLRWAETYEPWVAPEG
jgi:hypothetical protein